MRSFKKLLIVLATSMLTACRSPATLIPVEQPDQPAPIATFAEPSIDPNAPVTGGALVIGTTQSIEKAYTGLVSEGLLMSNAEGGYEPVLAAAMPSVSEDGLTVTYTLRQGIKFSDASDFNCWDIQFTLDEIRTTPDSTVQTGYDHLSSVDCPDPYTAILTFEQFYPPYLDLFTAIASDSGVHASGLPPVGTGPWMVQLHNQTTIALVKNPYYREIGKPYLDSLTIQLVPDQATGLNMLTQGAIDLLWNISEADRLTLGQPENITIVSAPTGENELLVLNFADPNVNAPADAAQSPHPALADLRVRQAIQLGLDKQKMVDTLFHGQTGVGTNVLPSGEFACPQPASPFDPVTARSLLEEAGWLSGADGIREKEGKRLSLRVTSTSSDPLREQVEQILSTMLKDIGLELVIENVPTEALFADWQNNGLRKHGNFDLLLYTSGPTGALDPDSYLFTNFHSARIPTTANGGLGSNFSRYSNSDVDLWLDEAARSTDLVQRKYLYCQVAAQINQDLPRIFLYQRQFIAAYANRLQNYVISVGLTAYTQSSQNWWVRP